MRNLAIIAGIAAPLAFASISADAAMLRESAVVDGTYILAGDLFQDAGENAEVAVAYSPAPGKRAVFDARWLYRVARAYNIDWRPVSAKERVVVEREAQIVESEQIADAILRSLADKNLDPDAKVDLGNNGLKIYLTMQQPATVAVEDISYDQASGRFVATIAAPADDPAAQRLRINGEIRRMLEVPVLGQRVARDGVITEQDIEFIQVAADRLQRNVILDAAELIGKQPSRYLRPGQPVRANDLRTPLMIEKGALVTMILRTSAMTLTAQGKALEDGGKGQTIRVLNTQSYKNLEAIVTGPGTVEVHVSSPQVAMK